MVLTPPVPTDPQEVLALLNDPRTVAHNPSDRLRSLDEATALISRWRSQWQRYGFGYWRLADEPAERELVGYCGVKTVRFRGEEALNLVYRLARPRVGPRAGDRGSDGLRRLGDRACSSPADRPAGASDEPALAARRSQGGVAPGTGLG